MKEWPGTIEPRKEKTELGELLRTGRTVEGLVEPGNDGFEWKKVRIRFVLESLSAVVSRLRTKASK